MKTRVQRWGNSLALRIPKAFADQIGIADNTMVDIALADGKLTIMPLRVAPPSLDALLAGITEANLHAEVAADPPRGDEVW